MDVRLPDGTIIRNVPDGTTKEELTAKLKANGYNLEEPAPVEQPKEQGLAATAGKVARMATPGGLISSLITPEGREFVGNAAAGGVRGAGSIGATILAPFDVAADAAAGKGLTLESNRQRRADMDATLQAIGADPESLAFQGGKVGTEVAGTMGTGTVLANALARVLPQSAQAAPVVNQLLNAIRSGGMSTGARTAPGVAPQAANLAIRSAGGAVHGGAAAGLVNPEDADVGALVGGTIPVASKVLGVAGHAVGAAVSPTAARTNATNKIARTVGEDQIPQVIADVQTHFPKGAENIPLSTAAITKNPGLAQLEQGSRLNSAPAWFEFDQRQGKAVFDNVMDATQEAGELGARKALRAENWQAAWAKASEAQKPRIWAKRMTQFGADLEQAVRSPAASNPEVRAVLDAVNAELDRVGPGFSPAHLQQIRANLNGKVQALSGNVFKSAPRDNPAIISLKQELDDILNVSTGGKWQKVLEGYAKDTGNVHAAAAAGKVRSAFVDKDTGRVLGTALNPDGDVAKVTEAGLGRAMNAARQADGSLALSPAAEQRLSATLDALRRQNVVRGVKNSALAGGGSDTIPNALASGAAQEAGAPNMLLQVLGAVRKVGRGKTDNALAELLSNPDELALVLQRYLQPPPANRLLVGAGQAAPALAADR